MISSLGVNQGLQTGLINKSTDLKKTSDVSQSEKSDKVAQISEAIANGSYKIDISKTARAIAQTLA
ncbi:MULTISPECIES: flagellar biosynthesis anti-sigma factor FlgM [unclassified Campylobacter]|uniref:flagellar biosynthesis anti-sigma factor FlgM n=1 Tax=unclassified Campylobacter TaxID=2593542 RepID=UPI003D3373D3